MNPPDLTLHDFSDHPRSVAEIRSDQTGLAKDWTPRDALISILREIDAGRINPSRLVIVTGTTVDDTSKMELTSAGTTTRWERRGLLLEAATL